MPESDNLTDAENVSASDYKKLQRKYDRRNNTAKKAEERVEGLESSMSRLESLVEGLTALVVASDDSLRDAGRELVDNNASRRSADETSAQLTARLNQSLEDADEEWADEKFDAARRVLDEINASGDLARASEVESIKRSIHRTRRPSKSALRKQSPELFMVNAESLTALILDKLR